MTLAFAGGTTNGSECPLELSALAGAAGGPRQMTDALKVLNEAASDGMSCIGRERAKVGSTGRGGVVGGEDQEAVEGWM